MCVCVFVCVSGDVCVRPHVCVCVFWGKERVSVCVQAQQACVHMFVFVCFVAVMLHAVKTECD